MNVIKLQKILPEIFAESPLQSGVWQKKLEFEKGKFYLIEAASGKGKSSLFSFLYGYRNDFLGETVFDNQNINSFSAKDWNEIRRKNISLLFQDLRLFPELTALENIELKNRLTNYKTRAEILQMIEYLQVADKTNEKCEKLSWGQQQRVAIVRALCQPFDFLLLDEPVSHIDDLMAVLAADLIKKEAKNQGAAVIVSSIGKNLPLNYEKKLDL
ncbi:MAG: ATP-binding cassette domain-containing protein [Prevotellaceae bacterium]|jgi:ABC-type lipoprotein export system ATPase subunit|nr:ATP-binding cassette domain-containing protein [Prevotellaceae bacterium]